MDSLIAIGSGAAFVYGVFAIYRLSYGLGAMGRENFPFRLGDDIALGYYDEVRHLDHRADLPGRARAGDTVDHAYRGNVDHDYDQRWCP